MNNFLPGLYIVSTPIGNLEDITFRALNVLKNSDRILCEDTRRSIKLLNHYGIKNQLVSNHKFNEQKILSSTVNFIKSGKVVSIISDAGTPILSDPGLILLKECIKNKIDIFPIPGVSAITTAMSVSGFDDKYIFYGFLPKKNKELEKVINDLRNCDFNIVFFIPKQRLNFYLKYLKKFFTGRNVFIAREMTKIYETFYRGKIDTLALTDKKLQGEITVVLSKKINKKSEIKIVDKKRLLQEIKDYLGRYTLKDVVKLISEKNNLPKKQIYNLCLNIKKK